MLIFSSNIFFLLLCLFYRWFRHSTWLLWVFCCHVSFVAQRWDTMVCVCLEWQRENQHGERRPGYVH